VDSEREAYARNDEMRCYHCKAELYATPGPWERSCLRRHGNLQANEGREITISSRTKAPAGARPFPLGGGSYRGGCSEARPVPSVPLPGHADQVRAPTRPSRGGMADPIDDLMCSKIWGGAVCAEAPVGLVSAEEDE
jgi:hypothetical protein